MGKTSQKLAYLNETKRLMRRRINSLGGSITLETKFRDYLNWLDRFYNAAASPINIEILGETKLEAVNTSANLLPLYDDEIVTDGVTVTISDGGKITINGTPTRDLVIKLTNGMETDYKDSWRQETVLELDSPTDLWYQLGIGGGTTLNDYSSSIILGYRNNIQETSGSLSLYLFASTDFSEKHIKSSYLENNVTKVSYLSLSLKENVSYNLWGYIQLAEQKESTWVANNNALPPSPDNPKTITNKTGDITYTASDGEEFTVSLFEPDVYNCPLREVSGIKDRIYYENGKFYYEKNIDRAYVGGVHQPTITYSNSIFEIETLGAKEGAVGTPNALSNYYDSKYSSDNYSIYVSSGGGATSILDNRYSTTSDYMTWADSVMATNPLEVQYVLEENDTTEITNSYPYTTLYNQLQAILDHETQLEINKKIIGEE